MVNTIDTTAGKWKIQKRRRKPVRPITAAATSSASVRPIKNDLSSDDDFGKRLKIDADAIGLSKPLKGEDLGFKENKVPAANIALEKPIDADSIGLSNKRKPDQAINAFFNAFGYDGAASDKGIGDSGISPQVITRMVMGMMGGQGNPFRIINLLNDSVEAKTFGEANTVCLASAKTFIDSFLAGFSQEKAKEAAGAAFLEGVAALPDFESTPSLCGKASLSIMNKLDEF